MTRDRILLALLALLTGGVLLIDLYLLPELLLPTAPYAVVILIAAYLLPPGMVVGVTVWAMVLLGLAASIQQPPLLAMTLNELGLALVGYLGTALSIKMRREAGLAGERGQALAREQAARAEAEARTRQMETLLEAVPDGIMVVDRQGNVVAANSALAAQVGFAHRRDALEPLAEYQRLLDVCYPDGRPYPPAEWPVLRALRGERVGLSEMRLQPREGPERLVQISVAPVRNGRGEVVQAVAVMRDVTERRRRERQWEVLARIGQALSRELDLEAMVQTVMDQTLQVLGADLVDILLADPERRELVLAGYRNLQPETVEIIRSVPFDSPYLAARAFATGELQVVEDTSRLAPELAGARTLADMEGARSLSVVPLRAASRTIGTMLFGTRTPHRFAPDELEMVVRVAELFGMAIENARLYDQVRAVNERMAVTSIQVRELAELARRRADELNAVIDSMAEGVLIFDGEGRLVRINQAARERWELPTPEALATVPVQLWEIDLRYPDGRPFPRDEWAIVRALRGEMPPEQEIVYVRPDGSRRNLLTTASTVRDATGKIVLAVSVYRDITPIRALEQQREEFISVVAHDLRGALTAIKGHADLLVRPEVKEALPGRVQRSLDAISTSGGRMGRMIADLLDVSRIEARRLTLDKRPIDLASLVPEILRRSEELTKAHPVRVEVRGEIPRVEADPDRIEQVLANLLSNAGKYSYPDTEITVEMEPRPGEVMTSVTNLGPGIRPEDREKLFTRFHRTRQAREERVPGLGLGLYIAKGLVEAHGGRIWIESLPEKYARFRFTLPIAVPSSEGGSQTAGARKGRRRAGSRTAPRDPRRYDVQKKASEE